MRTSDKGGTDYAIRRRDGLYLSDPDGNGRIEWSDDSQLCHLWDTYQEALDGSIAYGLDNGFDGERAGLKDGYEIVPVDWINEEDIRPDEIDRELMAEDAESGE